MSTLARALLDQLGPEDLAELAQRLAPYLQAPAASEDGWMNAKQTADYLGISIHALHRLTSERRIPFTQERPGARCYFRRAELDEWRGGG